MKIIYRIEFDDVCGLIKIIVLDCEIVIVVRIQDSGINFPVHMAPIVCCKINNNM